MNRCRLLSLCIVLWIACKTGDPKGEVDLDGIGAGAGNGGNGGLGQVVAGEGETPYVTFGPIPEHVRGGTALTVALLVVDRSSLTHLGYALAENVQAATSFEPVGTDAESFTLTLPSVEMAAAHFYLSATNTTGNTQIIESPAFHIDALGPTTRSVPLAPGPVTRSPYVHLTVSDCTDAPFVLVNESTVPPAETDPAWRSCASYPMIHTLANEGTHTVSVWFKDALGNVSSESTLNVVIYDATPPFVSLLSFTGGEVALAGSTLLVSYVAGDTVGLDVLAPPVRVDVSTDGGQTFAAVPGCQALPEMGDCAYASPMADLAALRFRVTVRDVAGHEASASSLGNVGIDLSPPAFVPGQFAIDFNRPSTPSNFVNVSFVANDTISPIGRFCLQKFPVALAPATPTVPAPTDGCWQLVSAANGGLAPSAHFSPSPAFTYPLGPVPATVYRVYAWVEDSVGHVSALASGGSGADFTDRDEILYKPATPAVVKNVAVANVPSYSYPPAANQLCFNTGSCPAMMTAYVAWHASDDLGLPETPVDLEYSTDSGVSYTPIPGGSDRPNNGTSDGSTTCPDITGLDATPTGCFAWTSDLPGVSFIVRVRVTDADNLVASAISDLMNNGSLRIIAGNTDQGFPGSASNVLFAKHYDPYGTAKPMTADENGVLFIADGNVGIVRVHPQDGSARVFIPNAISSAPADYASAPLAAARITKGSRHIALDHSGALLIYDNKRIRRVPNAASFDVSALTVEPFIGGGSSTDDTTDASSIALDSHLKGGAMMLTPLPNGDLLFSSEGDSLSGYLEVQNFRVRHYHAATGQITSVTFFGTGHSGDEGQPLAICHVGAAAAFYDPAFTSGTVDGFIMWMGGPWDVNPSCPTYTQLEVARFDANGEAQPNLTDQARGGPTFWMPHTGRDGSIYLFSSYITQYKRFNPSANAWTLLMGQYNTGTGNCVEGSDPLDAAICNVTPLGIDATPSGQVYYYESGQVRVVDSMNTVRTLAGQPWWYGDGMSPLSARFGDVAWLDMWRDGATRKVLALDTRTSRIRELTDSNIEKVVGALDGHSGYGQVTDLGSPANESAYYGGPFAVNGTNGNVYLRAYGSGLGFGFFAATGRGGASSWQTVVAGFAHPYYSTGDDQIGSQIWLGGDGNIHHPLGWNNDKLFAFVGKSTSQNPPMQANAFFKIYDGTVSFTQKHVAGMDNPPDDLFCPEATLSVSPTAASCHLKRATYMKASYDSTIGWITSPVDGDRRILGFMPNGNVTYIDQAPQPMRSLVYVPDFGGDPAVVYCEAAETGRLFKLVSGAQSALTTLPDGMSCAGYAMLYDDVNRSIIFGFSKNGFGGVAEYTLP